MALNKEREEVIIKIANELTLEEAVEIFRLVMENASNKEDGVEKYYCMRMGCDDKLFNLITAYCDKDDEIHNKIGEIIQEEFTEVDSEDFEYLVESGHNCTGCGYFNKETCRCTEGQGERIEDAEHTVCSNYYEET